MAEVEELRVQPQDILAEAIRFGAIFIDESKLVLCENTLSLETSLSMLIV